MDTLLFSLLNGVIYGLLLFMVSAGLTLVFGMMGVLNFAHASFYMLGAYFAYTLQGLLGFGLAVVVATLLAGGVGAVVERFFLRRVHHHGHAHELLLTFGLSFIVAETIKLLFGNFPVNYQVPALLDGPAFVIVVGGTWGAVISMPERITSGSRRVSSHAPPCARQRPMRGGPASGCACGGTTRRRG